MAEMNFSQWKKDAIWCPETKLFVSLKDFTCRGQTKFTYSRIKELEAEGAFPEGCRILSAANVDSLFNKECGGDPYIFIKTFNLEFNGFIPDYKMKSYLEGAVIEPDKYDYRLTGYYRLNDYSEYTKQGKMLIIRHLCNGFSLDVGNTNEHGFAVRLVADANTPA